VFLVQCTPARCQFGSLPHITDSNSDSHVEYHHVRIAKGGEVVARISILVSWP